MAQQLRALLDRFGGVYESAGITLVFPVGVDAQGPFEIVVPLRTIRSKKDLTMLENLLLIEGSLPANEFYR